MKRITSIGSVFNMIIMFATAQWNVAGKWLFIKYFICILSFIIALILLGIYIKFVYTEAINEKYIIIKKIKKNDTP